MSYCGEPGLGVLTPLSSRELWISLTPDGPRRGRQSERGGELWSQLYPSSVIPQVPGSRESGARLNDRDSKMHQTVMPLM